MRHESLRINTNLSFYVQHGIFPFSNETTLIPWLSLTVARVKFESQVKFESSYIFFRLLVLITMSK